HARQRDPVENADVSAAALQPRCDRLRAGRRDRLQLEAVFGIEREFLDDEWGKRVGPRLVIEQAELAAVSLDFVRRRLRTKENGQCQGRENCRDQLAPRPGEPGYRSHQAPFVETEPGRAAVTPQDSP